MNTAISTPDSIFKEADDLAKLLGVSRNELYTRAVLAFVKKHRDEQVIEALNAIYSEEPSELDNELQRLQVLTFTSKWIHSPATPSKSRSGRQRPYATIPHFSALEVFFAGGGRQLSDW